ncbi:hypothetical protein ACWCQW_51960 [Streptomyces mirabilis]
MNNDRRTESAMVVIAAVVVGMIAVAYPTSIPVIDVVAAVVTLLLVWLKLRQRPGLEILPDRYARAEGQQTEL